MKLTQAGLREQDAWKRAGIALPQFDRTEMCRKTLENPTWLHFGAGNIFRAFPAAAQQKLLDQGRAETGIITAEGFDGELLERVYRPHDDLSLLALLKADGTAELSVVGSVAKALHADPASADWAELRRIFAAPSLQMVSFTITEKGYTFTADGSTVACVADLLLERFQENAAPRALVSNTLPIALVSNTLPIALVSMDNCSRNGEKLQTGILAVAERRAAEGKAPKEFLDYLRDPKQVSFPWSMIDKITPRPDTAVQKLLEDVGVEEMEPVLTAKNTYAAPFVNAEEAEYLVIEDAFPNGRPPLEQAGFYFADRETVSRTERMKVCTCLNPLHTALAVFGCLLGYPTIHSEMKDPALCALVKRLGYVEGLPVVTDPGILRPEDFLREVLEIRLPNPFMPDTPQRIATDTSQKLSIRFGETIKEYRERGLPLENLQAIPLVFAGWCRYLLGVDDAGKPMELSADPLLAELRAIFADVELGKACAIKEPLQSLLCREELFGVNLVEVGLAEAVTQDFVRLCEGSGAVRRLLLEKAEAWQNQ